MKKLPLLIGLIALSIGAFAQSKGDMYVVTSIDASLGKMSSYEIYNNQSIHFSRQPMNTEVGLEIGFGYFVTNGFRLELGVSGYIDKSPREQVSTDWLNNFSLQEYLSFNCADYFFTLGRFAPYFERACILPVTP